ncbi:MULTISPECIES: hypothetical protein [Kamptonema]|uniref:hypothetical protein n=1 Tax=Kamptonema TaxID=1501433 RepID=UPI0001DAD0C9|nr:MULTISPECIES: hypothetical protein [Kamptonema]CBN57680.1 hypothetical protein OSCI_3490060 [Kamptonema sp. PCC 6506]
MTVTTDQNILQPIKNDADLVQLRSIVSVIIGELCWNARMSYGDELYLYIGERIPILNKLMKGKEQAAWMLGTRGTDWTLESPTKEIITSSKELPEVFKEKVKVIEGTTITAFETHYPDLILTVEFSNGCKLKIFPDLADDFDLSYWELFTPDNMLLTLEPGAIWTYTRADVPKSAKINQHSNPLGD